MAYELFEILVGHLDLMRATAIDEANNPLAHFEDQKTLRIGLDPF